MSLAIIGGTGLTRLDGLEITRREVVHTPYGDPSGPITHGVLHDKEVMFLARHGYGHTIPPHRVNYRANIWALRQLGVERIIAVAAVGGITEPMAPCTLVIPDQIVDYTWGRHHTYFEQDLTEVTHVDFSYPYDETLRQALIATARERGLAAVERGTYGATQGPRLETAAEIARMKRDGCDVVGMTGMPEAVLARELGLGYACCAVVVNWAAGVHGDAMISMAEIDRNVQLGMEQVRNLLAGALDRL
jgi:5'-methylthioinosine phosphorylase